MGTIYYINASERSLKARVFQALSLEQIASENEIPAEEPGDEGTAYAGDESVNQGSGADRKSVV